MEGMKEEKKLMVRYNGSDNLKNLRDVESES